MSARWRALCSVALGIAFEVVLVWLCWKTFSFHNAKDPSIFILNIHAPAAHLLSYLVGKDNALACSFVVMALCWSAAFFFVAGLVRRLKHHDTTLH